MSHPFPAQAYMAELTSDLGDAMQRINAKARVCEMASMLLYMIVVAALEAFFFGVKDTARVAQALSCAVGGPIAVASWRFLTPRPTQHDAMGFIPVREEFFEAAVERQLVHARVHLHRPST